MLVVFYFYSEIHIPCKMFRKLSKQPITRSFISSTWFQQKNTFLTNDYKCTEAWNSQTSSPILNNVNLSDFYSIIDQNHASKGVISAIDVDIFANSVKDPEYLEELKDLLHKLRLSAETGSTLESTQHATVRKFIEYGTLQELVDILKDPLNFGVFLDHYSANILLDTLLTSQNYELAASVASQVMLQEDFSNKITCSLCQYACYKYIAQYEPKPEPPPPVQKQKVKIEEKKIRIKYLRNPYFDDHFDLQDQILLSGKTLAWISEQCSDNLNNNIQLIGWLMYKKYDKLLALCEKFSNSPSSTVYPEVMELFKKQTDAAEPELKETLDSCIAMLSKMNQVEMKLEESLQNNIENAINLSQNNDISQQKEMFKSWVTTRENKLEEQTKRLDRAKRIQAIQDKNKALQEEEQKLWFFENEETIDLEIEEKEKLIEEDAPSKQTVAAGKTDDDYIPPEIRPKRK